MTLPERIPGIGRKAGSRRTPRDAAIHTDVPQAAKPPQRIHDRLCLAAGDKSTAPRVPDRHARRGRTQVHGRAAPSVAFLTGSAGRGDQRALAPLRSGTDAHRGNARRWFCAPRLRNSPPPSGTRSSPSRRLEALEAAAESAGILGCLPASPPERLPLQLTDAKAVNENHPRLRMRRHAGGARRRVYRAVRDEGSITRRAW